MSPITTDKRPAVVVIGPAPGQAGGISSVMSYLKAETSADCKFDVIFLDTMKDGRWSIPKFIGVVRRAIWIIAESKAMNQACVFHLNVSMGGSTYRKWFISTLCRIMSIPYIVHLHGSKYRTFFADAGPVVRQIIVSLFGSAESVVVLGKVWHEYITNELRVDKDRAVIVANGTPKITGIQFSREIKSEKVRVVFSGRVSEAKGVSDLLQAADLVYRDFKGFEVVIMGDSRDDDLLAKARSKPYCVVTGWLSHEDVVRELAAADVFTLPSHDEGLPMAMIEAMSIGIPVIVTSVGAISDVIEDGREGYLVLPKDVDALAAAIDSLVRNRSLREEMGRNALDRWKAELGAKRMTEQIMKQWDAALSVAVKA